MEQMLEELNKNCLVTAVQALEANIADYNAFEDKVYKQLVSGTIKQNHMFCGFSKTPGRLFVSRTSAPIAENMVQELKKGKDADRKKILDHPERHLPVMEPPSLRNIKKVELFTKWRKYVPQQYRSPLYDDPGKDVLDEVNEEKKNKRKKVKENKESNKNNKKPAAKKRRKRKVIDDGML